MFLWKQILNATYQGIYELEKKKWKTDREVP